jgi:hypothetical protein
MQVGDLVTFRTLRNQHPPDHQLLGVVVRQGETWRWGSHWFVLWANGDSHRTLVAEYDLEVINASR